MKNTEHSDLLKEIFDDKESEFIEHQMELLSRESNTRAWPWEEMEDRLLSDIMG